MLITNCLAYSSGLLLMRDALLWAMNICCFYWLMNKAALVYGRAEYSYVGNPSRDTGRKRAQSSRYQKLLEKQDEREKAMSIMVKYKLIEIG